MHLGYHDEARAWRDWLIRAVAGSPDQIQIMYGVGGERWLPELIVPWLSGYENSSPVRIGNAEHDDAAAVLEALKAATLLVGVRGDANIQITKRSSTSAGLEAARWRH
jgi:GH15 family glucan-1,4-alpha-glucosidase